MGDVGELGIMGDVGELGFMGDVGMLRKIKNVKNLGVWARIGNFVSYLH